MEGLPSESEGVKLLQTLDVKSSLFRDLLEVIAEKLPVPENTADCPKAQVAQLGEKAIRIKEKQKRKDDAYHAANVDDPEKCTLVLFEGVSAEAVADHDGSHIRGLILNMFDMLWPSLLKLHSPFVSTLLTPLAKVTTANKEIAFYTEQEYEIWSRDQVDVKNRSFRYLKGLGSATPNEAKGYFDGLSNNQKYFMSCAEEDSNELKKFFSTKHIKTRKDWLQKNEGSSERLEWRNQSIKISDFVNKELLQYAYADLKRSIPSVMDGFKPSQRKSLHAAFIEDLVDVDVVPLPAFDGFVFKHSFYPHRYSVLHDTIIRMAQNYVGSNNINLFVPYGQFGSRNKGGKDAADSRYLNTLLDPISRDVFPKEDNAYLTYKKEFGKNAGPERFAPIIPMVLVNGARAVSVGWSTRIPNFNPRDVILNIQLLLKDQKMKEMVPFYRGFKGTIVKSKSCYITSGKIMQLSGFPIILWITELPIGVWTTKYEKILSSMKSSEKIQDYANKSTDLVVSFVIILHPNASLPKDLLEHFKLTSSLNIDNMHLMDLHGKVKKYESVEQIFKEFTMRGLNCMR